jgi:AcrR family transcriptional regulator
MEPLSPQEEKQRGLTRERLVESGLELINEEGLEGLSMRALADRLEVKAASLYWHVRDRRELLELLAESILDGVSRPRTRATWRQTAQAIAEALRARVGKQKDANRILLEVPESLERSDTYTDLAGQFQAAGLSLAEARDVTRLAMTYVIAGPASSSDSPVAPKSVAEPASLAIDSGSRGVVVRAGSPDMQDLIQIPHERSAASPAVVRGETVVVRRLRGVGRGEIELNPRRPWKFKVQAPTWNTLLDVAGLDVREIWIDSGAANIECLLPEPRGVVPIHVSSGVVNVAMRRPRGAAVVATVHTGAVKLRLEDFSTKVTVLDVHWNTPGAQGAPDRYELDVSSGVVDFKLDSYVPRIQPLGAVPAEAAPAGKATSALEILLDGVEARLRSR